MSPFPFALLTSESDSVFSYNNVIFNLHYYFYNIELLCIFLYFIVIFVINLFSVIYMKDVENVS